VRKSILFISPPCFFAFSGISLAMDAVHTNHKRWLPMCYRRIIAAAAAAPTGVTGNPQEKDGLQYVKCWNDSASIIVRVGDSCPCMQKKPGGKVEPQFWCCGGANHMDISYW
jgi:hypothetical protein